MQRPDRVDKFLIEEGRKLDFSQVEKQLKSISELMKKLIPPKSTPISESIDKGKSISFKHLVNTDPPVRTNSKATTLNKVMSVKNKSFFPENLKLKSPMNGECFDNSSQKSCNDQIMASSQGHFQMHHEGSQYQTPIHIQTIPFTPVSTPVTNSSFTQKSDGTPRQWARQNSANCASTRFFGCEAIWLRGRCMHANQPTNRRHTPNLTQDGTNGNNALILWDKGSMTLIEFYVLICQRTYRFIRSAMHIDHALTISHMPVSQT
ncbi:uncharacterized protein LOC119362271 [Triticum dicoccoides]|uniref:uncharacterized protein LOC119362271 n=1 Tax=Triticum dicoccoides TaxID=85692 RepID=UPI000E7C9100|nr:uncharacterized protein LOC119362271 [Triticum dicoccoides]XP_037483366.1 uncharacterized protein LOC119362271 [Triticum dicoccoides]XP_037483367.1 uncharacterized protein LOC119362271 [Triticum dicoccoides]XP_037483368.1 uncharacterized protein LOC119362271 [Triticum dicoccoides]XP_037483369.1 uncharacterized protein LOC119362271 [Triticum dicoccoides]